MQEEIASKQRLRESFQKNGFYARWGKAPETDAEITADARRSVNFFKSHQEYQKFKEKPLSPALEEVLDNIRKFRDKYLQDIGCQNE